jgi:hypothetical protein
MGYVAYTSCPASEVPAGLTWGTEDRWPGGLLRKEYAWNPGDAAGDLRVFIAGAPWMRTIDTTLPENDPRRVTWFRQVPVTNLDTESPG